MAKKSLGFFVHHLTDDPLSTFIITAVNKFYQENSANAAGIFTDIIIFATEPSLTQVKPECAILSDQEMFDFNGDVVATSLDTTQILAQALTPGKRYFLDWNHEWIAVQQKQFEGLSGIYGNAHTTLLAKDQDSANLIGDVWNRSVSVLTGVKDLL